MNCPAENAPTLAELGEQEKAKRAESLATIEKAKAARGEKAKEIIKSIKDRLKAAAGQSA